MQEHQSSFVVHATPAEVWGLWFSPPPPGLGPGEVQVIEMDDVRIEILHRGDDRHEGLVRHCWYPVPRFLLSRGVAQSWELLTDLVPNESYRYRAITRPPFATAEGRQWLEDLGEGRTRVHFAERYSIANPVLRRLLERYLHGVISRNNDRAIQNGVQLGLEALRAAAAPATGGADRPAGAMPGGSA